jgi:hypothetical protein
MRLLRPLFLVAALLALLPLAATAQDASPLSGSWNGRYSYQTSAGRQEVQFRMDLTVRNGTSVSGRITEPNTFGDKSASALYANVVGIVEGRRLRLVKTYDGTGGANHSVYYEGMVDPGSQSISGSWTISDKWGGEFRVSKN